MPFSDSMFLLEIKVEELKSYIDCKEFIINSQFANIFLLKLKDPNDLDPIVSNSKKISKIKTKLKKSKVQKLTMEDMVQVGQSVLFSTRIDTLITTMKNFPIELTLRNKDKNDKVLGFTHIPWSPVYIDYLYKLIGKLDAPPVHINGAYSIYDDVTFKRTATITLNIKLTHLKHKDASFRSFPEASYRNKSKGSSIIPNTALGVINKLLYNPKIKRGVTQPNTSGKNRKTKTSAFNKKRSNEIVLNKKENKPCEPLKDIQVNNVGEKCNPMTRLINLFKSDTDLQKHNQMEVIKTKSSFSMHRKHFNMMNYIFGDIDKSFHNQVLCVGYFTVENHLKNDESSAKNSSYKEYSLDRSNSRERYTDGSMCSSDLPRDVAYPITVTECSNPKCRDNEKDREISPQHNDRIQLHLSSYKNGYRNVNDKVETVVGGTNANINFDRKDCFCSCEYTFEFTKHTTYCGICGGYERRGEDIPKKILDAPFPCPIYHKLVDKNKQKTLSTSGSDKSKNKGEDSLKSFKKGTKSPTSGAKPESDKGKGKKKRKEDKFRFNYGYKAPQLGHSRCVMPCTGTLGAVPKNMGWLWTADDVPGIKFRPMWRPGASNKHVVRSLKLAKYPDKIIKKKKKDLGKQKRPLIRPLLTVAKKNGEYIITMETMKVFSRPRALNQHPYEDKPVLTYTVGKTEEEKRERQKKKNRAKRRLERDQRAFIQSTFRHVCKEICLKTYQQALGILPDGEDPDCVCYPKYPGPDDTNLERSCSCSEDLTLISSDTDSDEWIIEFTPPNATFDPSYTGKRLFKIDNSSQYTYLDYKVKLIDRYGNQVPRFFRGPDGKTQCSDLGGFWSPDHKWLEINVDGYVGPDGRWAPMVFVGPNGEQVDCDTGKFQVSSGGIWLVVGVDGYIDATGKWKFYAKSKGITTLKKYNSAAGKKGAGDRKDYTSTNMPSEVTWSCFGDANAKELSKMGIFGHGHDRKLILQTLKEMVAHGEDVVIPQPPVVSRALSCKKVQEYKPIKQKCKHSTPSRKGIVAVDGNGHKTYFRLKDYKNRRPKERINQLTDQGISLSSFHAPCFHSFINREMMKKQQLERRI